MAFLLNYRQTLEQIANQARQELLAKHPNAGVGYRTALLEARGEYEAAIRVQLEAQKAQRNRVQRRQRLGQAELVELLAETQWADDGGSVSR